MYTKEIKNELINGLINKIFYNKESLEFDKYVEFVTDPENTRGVAFDNDIRLVKVREVQKLDDGFEIYSHILTPISVIQFEAGDVLVWNVESQDYKDSYITLLSGFDYKDLPSIIDVHEGPQGTTKDTLRISYTSEDYKTLVKGYVNSNEPFAIPVNALVTFNEVYEDPEGFQTLYLEEGTFSDL